VWGIRRAEIAAGQASSATATASKFAARSKGAAGRPSAKKEREAQCHLLRCIFGNPFRPASIAPAWRTSDVVKLALAVYENRVLPSGLLDNTGLAILADAVEEAGCSDSVLLAHLRSARSHVRGCWVVDAILDKE
jgi:hypothetical protein